MNAQLSPALTPHISHPVSSVAALALSAGRFAQLAALSSAEDIHAASMAFATRHQCTPFLPHLASVEESGTHPDPAHYALTQCRTAAGNDAIETFSLEQVGDLAVWHVSDPTGPFISGITHVSPSQVLAADLVIGVYRVGPTSAAAAFDDATVGMFSLLCSTIAVPRNRALLQDFVPEFKPLTPREQEVLRASSSGATAKVVGERLGITRRTVDAYIQSSMAKLRCSTKAHVIVRAMRLGLI
ncbi:MAG: response regulator transcription factor [Nevskiaceae bacterium]|nr:MAG: response regulator transcription factor [Nevskiaceae bacterium]